MEMIQNQIGLGKMLQCRGDIPACHVGSHGLNIRLGPPQMLPEALQSSFSFSQANMNDPSFSKIKNYSDVLAFLAKIYLINSNVADFLEVKRFVFST